MNLNLATGGSVEVSEVTFGREFNEPLVHQVVVAYLAAARQGSKAQKTRSQRRGGGKKPWRQKGTGRARAGTIRSPIWRGGGVTFAATPRDFEQKVNRKMYRGALRSILSELVRQEKLVIVEKFEIEQVKTKLMIEKLKGLDAPSALVLLDEVCDNVYLSSRNIPNVSVMSAVNVDPVSLISYPKVIMTVEALKKLEELLANA